MSKANRTRRHDLPEYWVWSNMKRRCSDPGHVGYPAYGGRGIKVCRAWADSFKRFLADLGPRPSTRHSLERIDNAGDYNPGNCRWATSHDQTRNRRSNVLLTVGTETKCLKDWAAEGGMAFNTLKHRLACGWPVEKAVRTGPKNTGRRASKKG